MPDPLLSLPTSVEERISGWIRIREKLAAQAKPAPRPRPTITLSRQFGCEGFPLALRLQERLELATQETWTIFDKALIDEVAAHDGISPRVLANLGDEGRALEAFGFHPRGALTTDEAYARIASLIAKVASLGNAIIMGRGGAILCRELPNAFHFRLVAGFDWRVESLARRAGISHDEASQWVKTQGRLRAQFIKRALGADVEDPLHYDALFNNERHSLEELSAAILAYVYAHPAS